MLTIQIEVAHPGPRLLALKAALSTAPDATRELVARFIRRRGFGAHVGGHHVAIHHATPQGAILEGRLAMVTGTRKDWQ